MPYQLKHKESVACGLQRIVREEFAAVAGHLRSLTIAGKKDEAIHDVRRHLRRLRALCQIWRGPLGAESCSREIAVLRDAGRKLSAVRDLEVRINLFRNLARDVGADAEARRIKQRWALEHRRHLRLACRATAVARLIQTVDSARRQVAAFPIRHVDWPVIVNALSRSYRRARKAFDAAKEKDASSDARHRWRKRTKVLEYQITMLRRTHRSARDMAETLNDLTDSLGEDHDLAVLDAALQTQFAYYPQSASGRALLSAISQRRTRLIKRARALGRRLFREKAREFVERLERWLHR